MGLEHVRQEIIAEAKRETQRLQGETAKEAAAILGAAEQKVTAYAQQAAAEQAVLMERVAQQELSAARFEAKKLLLNTRTALIDAVFAQLAESLSQSPEGQRDKLLGKLLDRAGKELDVHTVHVNARDAGIMSKRKVFVKPTNIIGGLVAESADGKVRVDYSFDTMLQQLRERELASIAKELF